MRLFRISARDRDRGRPSGKQDTKLEESTHSQRSSHDFLAELYLHRRINYSQMRNGILFRRLATAIYPTIGGPSMPNSGTAVIKGCINTNSGPDFGLWKMILGTITGKCGRHALDLLFSVLLENTQHDPLLQDNSLDISAIQNFRKALDIVGEVLASQPTPL